MLASELSRLNREAMRLGARHPQGSKTFGAGRMVIISTTDLTTVPALLLRPATTWRAAGEVGQKVGAERSFWVLAFIPGGNRHASEGKLTIARSP